MRVLASLAIAGLMAAASLGLIGKAHAAASAVVIDARNGDVLHTDNADTRQHAPALPKLMTIFLMFEAFEAGTVKPGTNIFVSGTAIKQPQPTLGLNHFDTLSAGDALNALVTVNANDAAAVLAEFLAGSEPRFVEKMNAKAKELGLTQTRFANISGAPHPQQFSTPRDMILFSLALMRTFPERAKGLVGTSFAWKGRTYKGPTSFLSALSGNTSANLSGSTLPAQTVNRAKSARTGDRDVIAVVWNATSATDADQMIVASLTAAKAGRPVAAPVTPPVTTPSARPGAFVTGSWGLQLGAFSTENAARAQLAAALKAAPELARAQTAIETLTRPTGTLYRAQYRGADEATARRICASLKSAGAACIPLSR